MNKHYYNSKQGVYLIHFDTPYKHARHYIGYSDCIPARLVAHQLGKASPLTRAARQAGIILQLARTWPGAGRHYERYLHERKESRSFCPICTPGCEKRSPQPRAPKGYKCPF